MKSKTIKWDGRQITKPGIYSGIPMSAYHHHEICDGPSISSSGLRAIWGEDSSPKHFYAQWSGNPNRILKPVPKHFIIGRALHHLLLGEAFFSKLFVIRPDEWPDRRTGELRPWSTRQECKDWIRARMDEGRDILTTKDADMLRQMAISVDNHPLVKQGALNGQIERSLFWKDKETGIWLKSRPDAIPTDSADVADLKTTHKISWGGLADSIKKYGYYQQAALVREAFQRVLDMQMASFTYIFVEKQEPWHTRDMRVADEDIDRGARANRAAIRIFAKCVRDNHWPGPGDGNEGNEKIGLSPAARERIDARLKNEGLADGIDT